MKFLEPLSFPWEDVDRPNLFRSSVDSHDWCECKSAFGIPCPEVIILPLLQNAILPPALTFSLPISSVTPREGNMDTPSQTSPQWSLIGITLASYEFLQLPLSIEGRGLWPHWWWYYSMDININVYLKDSLIDTSCPFGRTKAVASSRGLWYHSTGLLTRLTVTPEEQVLTSRSDWLPP